ncbi:hypothetical protein OTB20_14020 [Streptomyces sp. H27-H1]|uniref:hypothetical protein n=1 Tax=Streptomyces sp. H27-H1 TaxID=2996461 RepID=UPI00226E231A|nr:hypothetical protein [Streptomyces sp. H27-H1]MCY0927305.1 hypothetical protein [Streptomyces sp. H27-H1]
MAANSRVPSFSSPHTHTPVRPSFVPRHPSSATCPPARPVPLFAPLRVGRAGDRLRRAVRRRRRGAAAGLAVVAAVLAVGGAEAQASRGSAPPAAKPPPAAVRMVSAPVRIADAATVRLLRPGDRVDVVAAERGGPPRVVASGARVAEVPAPETGVEQASGEGGALVVLSVPRDTARALVGAGTLSRLAVTLC